MTHKVEAVLTLYNDGGDDDEPMRVTVPLQYTDLTGDARNNADVLASITAALAKRNPFSPNSRMNAVLADIYEETALEAVGVRASSVAPWTKTNAFGEGEATLDALAEALAGLERFKREFVEAYDATNKAELDVLVARAKPAEASSP